MYYKFDFKKALVVGGAGFIGSYIVDALLKNSIKVSVIDNLSSGRMSNIEHNIANENFNFYEADITHDLSNIYEEYSPDVVFFLAAIPRVSYSVENPAETDLVNINGLVNSLELSYKSGVKRFVFSSSSSVYGGTDKLPTKEDDDLNPCSPYALQKMCGEQYCKLFSNLYGLDTVALRYFNVFGPRQYGDSPYSSVISAFCEAIKNNLNPKIYGDGEQFRDFCYIDNVVHGNLLAALYDQKLNGEAFNIGCGSRISVNDLYRLIFLDNLSGLIAEYCDERQGDVRHSQANTEKAAKTFGYKPFVEFEDGLKLTVEWYSKL